MKKSILLIGALIVGLSIGKVMASCVGPYCWDERGASITSGVIFPGLTLAQIQVLNTQVVGEVVFCTNCTSTPLCISTGTTNAGSFAAVGVSTSATTAFGTCK